MCEVSFSDDIEDVDVDEELLENYFNDYYYLHNVIYYDYFITDH